jgi:protein O-GlcNAc transferase
LSQNRKQRRMAKGHDNKEGLFPPVQSLFDQALQHHQAGRLVEAEALYRQVLAAEPNHADSLHLLGVLAHQVGALDIAAELIGKAIAIDKAAPPFHNNLGTTLQDQGKLDEAAACFRQALALKPDYAEAYVNLGNTLKGQEKFREAIAHYERALVLRPDIAQAHNNLGTVLRIEDRLDDAIGHYRSAIALKPGYAEAHHNLGHALKNQGKLDEAVASFLQATILKPDRADSYISLGEVLHAQGKPRNAMPCFERALALNPDSPEAHFNLGQALQNLGQFDEANVCYERALALKPDSTETLNDLGNLFVTQGRLDEAMACYRRILALKPDSVVTWNNLLFTMIYAASVSPKELADEAQAFGARVADPLLRKRTLIRDKNPERRLRIGYVSPDFHDHAVNYFFEPLLRLHDRAQFEVFAYSNNQIDDAVTARLKKEFDHWRDIKILNDDKAADLIEADQIDILVDMAGHTGYNRLLIFARKPAPVQVTWLGFPATTGMKSMDYRITDVHAEPEGMTESLNVETLWRLPEIFCCYGAHENSPAVIDHPPFEDNGYITFGCFNNFAKVTDPVLATWAQIMERVPNSRLLLEIRGLESPKFRGEIETRLQCPGLELDRVILEPRKRSNQFVLYNKIDIALDPFPCVGGTTSMDTLWMGVPLVTLAGKHFVSRMGVTILTNAGMPELIAKNADEYTQLAASLANDRERLRALRHNLREKVTASPLMNQEKFTRTMEAAWRGMWRKWCEEAAG